MLDQVTSQWLADQIELDQYRVYATVLPDVREVIQSLRAGKYVEEK